MSIFSKSDRRFTALWLGSWLLLALSLLCAANWQADRQLRERMDAFEKHALDLSGIAEQIVVGRMRRFDEVLLVLREAFVADRAGLPATIKLLRSGPLADAELLVVLIDRNGYVAYTDAPNVPARLYLGDRAYFRFFADGGQDRFYIDEPGFGRTTRRYTVPLARPVFDRKGEFLGVVALSVKQETLGNFGHAAAPSIDTAISIASLSGAIVARSRELSRVQGTKLSPEQLAPMLQGSEGVYSDTSADGNARTVAYQRPKNLPLIIFTESSANELLRETAQQRTILLFSAGFASLLALALLLGLLQRRTVMNTLISAQQAHLQEAQRIAGMGSWELDLASSTFKWSDEVYRLFGVSAETFNPSLENFLLLVVETDRARVGSEIEKTIAEGHGAIEFSLRRGDGLSRTMLGRGEALRDETDQVTALIGTVRDITEQRAAEHALAQSEEKLRAITDNVNTVMFLKDLNGHYLHINRQYETLFHISNAAIQGKTDHDIFPAEMADAFIRHDQLVIQSGRSLEVEEEVPHDDGNHFYVSVKFPIRNAAGEIYAVCGIATDITERKRAELMSSKLLQRNQVLMQNALDGIHILNDQGQLLEANDSFCRLLGYTPDEVTHLKLADWEAQMSADEQKEVLAGLLAGGHAVFETLNRRKDGSLIDVEVSAVGIELAGERFLYAASRDITERKHTQQQLESLVQQRTAELSAALQAAKVADQAKDAFLANITHELRTPLSAMIGFSGLARPFSSDPQQRDYLDKIISAGKTLSGVINDLLDLSKIAAGRMELETATFSLRQLLSRSRSVMSYKAEEKGLALIERIDDEVPDTLLGDPLRIEQILLNLLSNAVKFTASGRVEIRVGLDSRADKRICLSIEVEDTGIGLREQEMALLFKSFSQTDASMSRRFGGTGLGLGLAICKHLAEMMGGEIGVRSREGCGTTFQVKLWLALGEASELAAAQQPVDRTTLPASYRDARILVVDDQQFNREVVAGLLAVVGIVPRMASNGQEALDLLSAAGPAAFDLILMDIQMPVMDGLTATRLIRKLDGFGELPIVAMTAHTMTHEKEIGSAAGMNEHIGKPFDDLAFYSVLAKWIPRRKHRTQPVAALRPLQPAGGTLPAMHGIDTDAGLALFVGDETRYRYWLIDFVEQTPVYLAQIRRAIDSRQAEDAGRLAHTLKGRGGMLGMGELQTIAAALETAGDADERQDKLNRLDQVVRLICEEISRAFDLPENAAPAPQPLPDALPAGPVPDSIVHLIAMLEAGDGDCAEALARCLEELGETAWAPHLQQASIHAKNFDYGAACKLLCCANRDPVQGK